jgi:hypothetical protein
MKPTPVVNRTLQEVATKESRLRGSKKPVSTKKRVRQIVGGAGLLLQYEEAEEKVSRQARFGGTKMSARDPIAEEARASALRQARKVRAQKLVKVLSHHLDHFERKAHARLLKLPIGGRGVPMSWLKGKTEQQLLDVLMSELCGRCRPESMLTIHTQYNKERLRRERRELLAAFCVDGADTKTIRKYFRL